MTGLKALKTHWRTWRLDCWTALDNSSLCRPSMWSANWWICSPRWKKTKHSVFPLFIFIFTAQWTLNVEIMIIKPPEMPQINGCTSFTDCWVYWFISQIKHWRLSSVHKILSLLRSLLGHHFPNVYQSELCAHWGKVCLPVGWFCCSVWIWSFHQWETRGGTGNLT